MQIKINEEFMEIIPENYLEQNYLSNFKGENSSGFIFRWIGLSSEDCVLRLKCERKP